MRDKEFSEQVEWIKANLAGKTISGAAFAQYGMGYSVTLHFSDGTACEISPEYDEGFRFAICTR